MNEDRWATYNDPLYYNMWAVATTVDTDFNKTFHVTSRDEALALCEMLNFLEEKVRTYANELLV